MSRPGVERSALLGCPIMATDVGYFSSDAAAKYAALDEGGNVRVPVRRIVDAAMNNRTVTVRDKHPDGTDARVNQRATEDARVKIENLKEAFTGDPEKGVDGWVWDDPERKERLEGIYNRTYNNVVPRQFDGSHLTLPGLNPDFATRDYRKNTVWRVIQNGNTLIAHEVGAGKTTTAIAAGMEMRRLGLISKPAYVVPNNLLEQWASEFLTAYPNAKLLVASKDEMSRDDRRAFVAKVASNDWDGILITHDAFTRIGISDEYRKAFVQEQIDELAQLVQAEAATSGKKDPSVKKLEKMKLKLQTRLGELMAEEKKDPGTSFEESGIDHIFLDEAHLFKNLAFNTRMQNVKGLSQAASQRAEDMFLKIRYLDQKRPGRSAVFLTGTLVSNTIAELWTMQRYLQPNALKERGLDKFDSWASIFGRAITSSELKADGRTFADVSRFAHFVNVPELIDLYSQIADTKTASDRWLPPPVPPSLNPATGMPGLDTILLHRSRASNGRRLAQTRR
jgi:N12 class adenine-specific DNA methylase